MTGLYSLDIDAIVKEDAREVSPRLMMELQRHLLECARTSTP